MALVQFADRVVAASEQLLRLGRNIIMKQHVKFMNSVELNAYLSSRTIPSASYFSVLPKALKRAKIDLPNKPFT